MENNIDILINILKYLLSFGGWGLLILLIIYTMFFPDRAEKFYAIFWKIISKIFHSAEKKYIAHDIQSKVNDYLNNYLSKEINGFKISNIKICWINEDQDQESFKNGDDVVLRMRKSNNQNKNLVNASMLFIAENVLSKVKRYISNNQRESIDIFVGKKFFEIEQKDFLIQFVDDFLQEASLDKKVNDFLYKYKLIDETGLFYPVFIQEMTFLGEKIFANNYPKGQIYEEVSGLINFLNTFASRKIGEIIHNTFEGKYTKFAIMIVGESWKVESVGSHPYSKHIKKLFKKGIETVYIIGDSRKENFINTVCSNDLMQEFNIEIINNKKYSNFISNNNGTKSKVNTYLLVLRKKDPNIMIDDK